jgi:hypothetical protein
MGEKSERRNTVGQSRWILAGFFSPRKHFFPIEMAVLPQVEMELATFARIAGAGVAEPAPVEGKRLYFPVRTSEATMAGRP